MDIKGNDMKIRRLKKPTKVKNCQAVIWHGPGHQSKSECELTGPHKQHAIRDRDFFWTKKKAFSGYFDNSPEDER